MIWWYSIQWELQFQFCSFDPWEFIHAWKHFCFESPSFFSIDIQKYTVHLIYLPPTEQHHQDYQCTFFSRESLWILICVTVTGSGVRSNIYKYIYVHICIYVKNVYIYIYKVQLMILKPVHHPAGMGRLMMKRSVLRLGELLIFEGRSLGKRMHGSFRECMHE